MPRARRPIKYIYTTKRRKYGLHGYRIFSFQMWVIFFLGKLGFCFCVFLPVWYPVVCSAVSWTLSFPTEQLCQRTDPPPPPPASHPYTKSSL